MSDRKEDKKIWIITETFGDNYDAEQESTEMFRATGTWNQIHDWLLKRVKEIEDAESDVSISSEMGFVNATDITAYIDSVDFYAVIHATELNKIEEVRI